MKLKQSPDDFRVEELTDVLPSSSGDFAFYRLDKKGWTTPDALSALRRRWKIDGNRLSYGGLKDRHAHTIQYLTVLHGPKQNLDHHDTHFEYLGQVIHPYISEDIRANRFTLTLRDIRDEELLSCQSSLEELSKVGVANYFDDQRFGSVPKSGEFVAKEMILGRFESALKIAIAAPYEHDRAPAKREKNLLNQHWGDWKTLKSELPKGHARSLVDYLVTHPDDFRGAAIRLRPDLQGLYLAAYQSHLWNRMLAKWLQMNLSQEEIVRIRLKLGSFPTPRSMSEEKLSQWKGLTLPLLSARQKIDPSDPLVPIIDQVMKEEGFPLTEMKIRGLQKPYFSKGDRAAMIQPDQLSFSTEPDEKHPRRQKILLKFELPRGCYATMIVKRITQ
jgi:tRNA pseudouridine13 synthase